jgi:hypothetical protein
MARTKFSAKRQVGIVCDSATVSGDEEAINQVLHSVMGQIPPGFTICAVKQDNHCLFRALSRVMGKSHAELRHDIVAHICFQSHDLFCLFMKDVNQNHVYKKKTKYWGRDSRALLSFMGYDMNMEPVLSSGKKTGIATLRFMDMVKILTFLDGDTISSYRERMATPKAGRGGEHEIVVAAHHVVKQHVSVLHLSTLGRLVRINHIVNAELAFPCEEQTLYLACIDGNQYHAYYFSEMDRIDTVAQSLLPSGFCAQKVHRIKNNRNSLFRALAHLWYGDHRKHDIMRAHIVNYIWSNWNATHGSLSVYMTTDQNKLTRDEYKQRMFRPGGEMGDYPELVAASITTRRKIHVWYHATIEDQALKAIPIAVDGPDMNEEDTLYLLQVSDGRFLPLILAPQIRVEGGAVYLVSHPQHPIWVLVFFLWKD